MAEMAAEKRKTHAHDEIRRWVEQHGGHPANGRGPAEGGQGEIQLDFPGNADGGTLDHIGWAEWFDRFEQHNLALLYQPETALGDGAPFYKLVDR